MTITIAIPITVPSHHKRQKSMRSEAKIIQQKAKNRGVEYLGALSSISIEEREVDKDILGELWCYWRGLMLDLML